MRFEIESLSGAGVVRLRSLSRVQFKSGKDVVYVDIGRSWIKITRGRGLSTKGCEFYCKQWDVAFLTFQKTVTSAMVDTEVEITLGASPAASKPVNRAQVVHLPAPAVKEVEVELVEDAEQVW